MLLERHIDAMDQHLRVSLLLLWLMGVSRPELLVLRLELWWMVLSFVDKEAPRTVRTVAIGKILLAELGFVLWSHCSKHYLGLSMGEWALKRKIKLIPKFYKFKYRNTYVVAILALAEEFEILAHLSPELVHVGGRGREVAVLVLKLAFDCRKYRFKPWRAAIGRDVFISYLNSSKWIRRFAGCVFLLKFKSWSVGGVTPGTAGDGLTPDWKMVRVLIFIFARRLLQVETTQLVMWTRGRYFLVRWLKRRDMGRLTVIMVTLLEAELTICLLADTVLGEAQTGAVVVH